jgi:hypothetical protein
MLNKATRSAAELASENGQVEVVMFHFRVALSESNTLGGCGKMWLERPGRIGSLIVSPYSRCTTTVPLTKYFVPNIPGLQVTVLQVKFRA